MEPGVVGVFAGRRTEDSGHVVGGSVPVEVEVSGAGAEEDVTGRVRRSDRVFVHLRVQGAPERVRGEDVAAVVPDGTARIMRYDNKGRDNKRLYWQLGEHGVARPQA